MINRNIILIFISATLLICMVGAASGADATPGAVETPVVSGNSLDTAPSLNMEDGAGTPSTTTLNPRAPIRKKPVPVKTPKPTTVMTAAPTVAQVTIPTTVPTAIPTTVPTAIPTTVSGTPSLSPSAAELQARLDNAYATGNARLAAMQAAYSAWTVPSHPDLIALATTRNAKIAGLRTDGIDNTVALQSLLDSLPTGAALYFPAGTYRINGPISIDKSVTLFGEPGTVLDCRTPTRDVVFTINKWGSANAKMSGVTITSLVIEGPGIETPYLMILGYYLQNVELSHVKFHNVGITAFDVRTSTDVLVEDCVFDNVFYTGQGYGVCICDHSDRIIVRDNFFVTKGRHGITTGTANPNLPPADYVQSVTVENNYFENMQEAAIDTHYCTVGPFVVKGNVVKDSGYGVSLRGGLADVSENVIIHCGEGIRFVNEDVTSANIGSKIDRAVGNILINLWGAGIEVDKTNVLIQDNVVQGPAAGYGIYLGPSAYSPSSTLITGNVLENWRDGFYMISTSSSGISMVNNWMKNGGIFEKVEM